MKEKHIREQIQILKDQLEEQMKHTDEYADRLMESEAQELQLKKNYDKVSGFYCSECFTISSNISEIGIKLIYCLWHMSLTLI